MVDILETLLNVSQMEEKEVKNKYKTSSSAVKKVLKALLLEELVEEAKSETKSEKIMKPTLDKEKTGSQLSNQKNETKKQGEKAV